MCFFVLTFFAVAFGANSPKHESIVQLLLPTLKTYENFIKNPAQYTKEVRQTLKDELHKDLVGLQQTLSDEKEFAELEKDLNEIIDSPDAIVSVVDEFSQQYSDKGFDPK